MLNGVDTLDDAQGNFIVQAAKSGKKALDEAFPIYRESQDTWDFSDSGWVFQQIKS